MIANAGLMPLKINGCVPDFLPHQERLFRLMNTTRCRYPGLFGGFGCGKTFAGVHLGIDATFINAGGTGVYTCLDYPILEDAIIPEFEQALAFYEMREGRDYTLDARLVFTNYMARHPVTGRPSRILFRPVDTARNRRKLVSLTAAWAICDEGSLYDAQVYRKISERVRDKDARYPFIATVSTPEGLNHSYDNYVKQVRERALAAGEPMFAPGERYRMVRGKTADNPNLDDEYVASLREMYDPQLVDAYLEGYFVPLFDGLVFSQFREDVHVTSEAVYNEHLPISASWDFNVNPMSVTLSHVKGDEAWTFDEVVLANSQTFNVCQEIVSRYGDHGAGMWIYGDAGGRSRSTKAHWTDYQIIEQELGIFPNYQEFVPRANPSVRDSINAVQALFLNGNREVSWYFNPQCGETIKSLLTTVWDNLGTGIKKGEDTYEHLTDTLRYLAWQAFDLENTLRRGRPNSRRGVRHATA